MCDVQGMSVTTAKQRLTTKTVTLRAFSRVVQVLQVAAHIVEFRVVLRVHLVLRVVNGVLVAVIVHLFCIPNSCIFHIAKTGLLRCCLYNYKRILNIFNESTRNKCASMENVLRGIGRAAPGAGSDPAQLLGRLGRKGVFHGESGKLCLA